MENLYDPESGCVPLSTGVAANDQCFPWGAEAMNQAIDWPMQETSDSFLVGSSRQRACNWGTYGIPIKHLETAWCHHLSTI